MKNGVTKVRVIRGYAFYIDIFTLYFASLFFNFHKMSYLWLMYFQCHYINVIAVSLGISVFATMPMTYAYLIHGGADP